MSGKSRCNFCIYLLAHLLALCIVQLLVCTPTAVQAIKCFKTSIGSSAHDVDCGALARACRIIIKPYKTQMNNAVTNCIDSQLLGRYVFDCAVECPPRVEDRYWNEVECCTSNMCNTGTRQMMERNCYVSKGANSTENDYMQPCNPPKACGVNVKTEETKCLDEAECRSGEWKCCSGDTCLNKWGVEKITLHSFETMNTGVAGLAASSTVGAACVLSTGALRLLL